MPKAKQGNNLTVSYRRKVAWWVIKDFITCFADTCWKRFRSTIKRRSSCKMIEIHIYVWAKNKSKEPEEQGYGHIAAKQMMLPTWMLIVLIVARHTFAKFASYLWTHTRSGVPLELISQLGEVDCSYSCRLWCVIFFAFCSENVCR